MNSYLHSGFAAGLVVFVLVALALPLWDYFETRRLKVSCTTKDRLRHYWTILVAHFALTAFSVWALGGRVLDAGGALRVADLAMGTGSLRMYLFGFALAFAFLALSPLISGLMRPGARKGYTRLVEKTPFGFIFPRVKSERYTFAAVSVSAGICEEIIFRSYFLAFFMSWDPLESTCRHASLSIL